MRSITQLELQYAHRFYGFQGEAQYLHGHTGVLTIAVEDTLNVGVNTVSYTHLLVLILLQQNLIPKIMHQPVLY